MIKRPDCAGFSAQPRGKVLRASVTPLASIFGSGFLIIVPILERTLGALAVVGMAAVCGLAWLVGGAIRHNVAVAGRADAGVRSDVVVRRVERASDLTIVVAYVISIALYLRNPGAVRRQLCLVGIRRDEPDRGRRSRPEITA